MNESTGGFNHEVHHGRRGGRKRVVAYGSLNAFEAAGRACLQSLECWCRSKRSEVSSILKCTPTGRRRRCGSVRSFIGK